MTQNLPAGDHFTESRPDGTRRREKAHIHPVKPCDHFPDQNKCNRRRYLYDPVSECIFHDRLCPVSNQSFAMAPSLFLLIGFRAPFIALRQQNGSGKLVLYGACLTVCWLSNP